MLHQFNIEIAKKFGVEEAIVIHHIAYWVKFNKANEKNFYDGYYWTFNSARAFTELLPYWNIKKISRLLTKLEENKIIKSGNYNETAYDRTKWYTICDKLVIEIYDIDSQKIETTISQKCPMEFPKMENGFTKSVQPIPYNKQYNKQDNKQIKKETIKEEILKLEITEVLKNKFIEYIDYRKEIKKPLKTIRPIKAEINKIGKDYKDIKHLILSIEESMNREYQGIFPIKNYNPISNPISNTTREDKHYNNYNNTESYNVMEKIEAKINTFISLGIIYKSDLKQIKELLEMDKSINPKEIKERLKGIPIVD